MTGGAAVGIRERSRTESDARSRQRRKIEIVIGVTLASGIAFQVAQRFAQKGYHLSQYERSVWYVTYQFGFVRRGLAGELLRLVLGHTPSLAVVELLQNVIALLTLGAAAALVVFLCRQRTVIAYAAAGLLVVAPFGFDFVGGSRGPYQLSFLLLAGLGMTAATQRVNPVALGLVGGSLLALCAFFSEASPLIVGPWLVLVVTAALRARGRRAAGWLAMFLVGLPSAATLATLALTGRATSHTVAALQWVTPESARGPGSVFPYLDDSLRDSFAKVFHRHVEFSIVVGLVLGGLLLLCARRWLPYARAAFRWLLPTPTLRRVWTSSTLAVTVVLFALGFDWLRWVTAIGFSALLATGAIVALAGRAPEGPPQRSRWHRPVPSRVAVRLPALISAVAAVYLLVLPPLPTATRSYVDATRLLLNVPLPRT